jgi:hypothetical protein
MLFHGLRAGHDKRTHPAVNLVPSGHTGCLAQIFDSAIGARTYEDTIY